MWKTSASKRFISVFSKVKKRDPELAERIQQAINELAKSERPEVRGYRKHGLLRKQYAWEFGNTCRLLYSPNYDNGIIELYRVCSHREVYD